MNCCVCSNLPGLLRLFVLCKLWCECPSPTAIEVYLIDIGQTDYVLLLGAAMHLWQGSPLVFDQSCREGVLVVVMRLFAEDEST